MIPVSRPTFSTEELSAVGNVFDTGWLGMGNTTYEFEKAVADRVGGRHVLAVNSGTSALHIALDSYGVGPGDEVIVPSLTYAACIQAILAVGAVPVMCESNPETLLIDPEDVAARITEHTRAIMPVHYCGQACDMDTLLALAESHRCRVVEDAAHAFGSTYKGKPIGSFGHVTCFSFDPIKIITCGEGGAVVVDDDEVAERMRQKRILGIDKETWHRYHNQRALSYAVVTNGYRYHMPNFSAAIGLVQLEKMSAFIARRRAVCLRYDEAFTPLSGVRPLRVDYAEAAPFMYVLRVPNGHRGTFIATLKKSGVDTGIHYIPNHQHPFFAPFSRGPLPVADRLGEEIVTLPLFSDISDDDVDTVISAVLEFEAAL